MEPSLHAHRSDSLSVRTRAPARADAVKFANPRSELRTNDNIVPLPSRASASPGANWWFAWNGACMSSVNSKIHNHTTS